MSHIAILVQVPCAQLDGTDTQSSSHSVHDKLSHHEALRVNVCVCVFVRHSDASHHKVQHLVCTYVGVCYESGAGCPPEPLGYLREQL